MVTIILHGEGSLPLPWSIRMKIALGAAKGLAFLHEEVQKPVIYRDFKTSNILLDTVSYYGWGKTCFHSYIPIAFWKWICQSRITMPSSLILDSLKMVLKVIRLMCLHESWEHMVMQPQNMSWLVSLIVIIFLVLVITFTPRMRLLDSDEQTEQTVFLSDVNNFHQVATYLSYNQPSGIDSMIKLQVHLICKKHRLLKDQYLVFLRDFCFSWKITYQGHILL